MPSRRRLASQPSIRWWRESPASLGPSPIGMRALVASSTRSRRPTSASPTISSERAGGVDVGRVDQVDPGVEAQVDLAAGAVDVDRADEARRPRAAEGHRAEREGRDAQAGAAELAVVHGAGSCHVVTSCPGDAAVDDRLRAPAARGAGRRAARRGRAARARRALSPAVAAPGHVQDAAWARCWASTASPTRAAAGSARRRTCASSTGPAGSPRPATASVATSSAAAGDELDALAAELPGRAADRAAVPRGRSGPLPPARGGRGARAPARRPRGHRPVARPPASVATRRSKEASRSSGMPKPPAASSTTKPWTALRNVRAAWTASSPSRCQPRSTA